MLAADGAGATDQQPQLRGGSLGVWLRSHCSKPLPRFTQQITAGTEELSARLGTSLQNPADEALLALIRRRPSPKTCREQHRVLL
jgi:hypothetical protein